MRARAFHTTKKYFPETGPSPVAEAHPSQRDEMILQYGPLIKYVAHRLAMRLPPHVSIDDLVSAGVIGLIDAIKKFDSSKQVRFKTYAEFRIRGAMLDELRSLDWVPRSVRQKAGQMEKIFSDLEKKNGRPAEDEEAAEALGLSVEAYQRWLSETSGVSLFDIDSLRSQEASSPEDDIVNQLIDDKEDDPFQALSMKELKAIVAGAIEDLPAKEKTIVSLYYYEELTLKEIGEVLGFTESRICQIHTKVILKLRSRIRKHLEEA